MKTKYELTNTSVLEGKEVSWEVVMPLGIPVGRLGPGCGDSGVQVVLGGTSVEDVDWGEGTGIPLGCRMWGWGAGIPVCIAMRSMI